MEHPVAEGYRRFADIEARDISPTYYEWALAIAGAPVVVALIAQLPGMKRQPNLVFAAARFVGAPLGPYAEFREWLIACWDAVVAVVMARSTQTNEAARCAVLLPVLARFDGPIALIEAGASAGLVLYPDRYSYRYEVGGVTTALDPDAGVSRVQLPCSIEADSVPVRLPQVVWRAGVDLNPIDVRDAEQMHWLETLIWPEHEERRQRLHAAATVVAEDPPHLVRGDIVDEIPALVEQAPEGAHVVVFHSAVLVYLTPERRAEFVEMMAGMPDATWISNEGEHVVPVITEKVTADMRGRTILAVNGQPVALVGPHGQSYQRL